MNNSNMTLLDFDQVNKNSILVSIIIATYKRDRQLRNAILSAINQTYESIEIIVVDDNSDINWNNKVSNIIYEMNQIHPIIYIQNEINKGSAETRNIGIRIASGKYITFLDDDDIYLPLKIKNQVEHMQVEDSDFSITDLCLYDECDRLIEKRNRKYVKDYDKNNLLKYHVKFHLTGTDVMMFKKEYLTQIGGFSSINVGDEFYLMLNAIESEGKFSYLPVCDVKAYVHSETDGLSSGDSKIKGENDLYVYKKKYFKMLSSEDRRYVNMRHYAVLAFAEMRRKKYYSLVKYAIKAFFASPVNCVTLFFGRK